MFVAYKQACPEVEATPNFMPMLWARIDAQRKSEEGIWRWANGFASAAAVVVVVLGFLVYQNPKPLPQRAYIEKLTDEISEDHFLDTGYIAKAKPVRWGGDR
ncbi:hypothetical protein [Bryobacter aggregatus]|uniref:hypothetical protein n=1 Tax=Bryobacter aggregatus TaxID=360054 RepID=UPI0004E27159|nr:hypothetical protein [Bryobacter aggregatus]